MSEVTLIEVFATVGGGGNPTPVVLDASAYDEARMLAVTRSHALESTFVFPPTNPAEADFRFRFFVPRQEMNMCGHATVGTLWLLHQAGKLRGTHARIETASGIVQGAIQAAGTPQEYAEITQPAGKTEELRDREARQAALDVLGIGEDALASLPLFNAGTSRVKTFVPLKDAAILHGLTPDFSRMEAVCTALGSTGLYPFVVHSLPERLYEGRHFPKASGFPEDVATGVAATALAFALVAHDLITFDDKRITVQQGRAMGRLSEIFVRFDLSKGHPACGCFMGGRTVLMRKQG